MNLVCPTPQLQLTSHFLLVPLLTFFWTAALAPNVFAQEGDYSTLEMAANDPYVAKLLGPDELGRLMERQQALSTSRQAMAILSEGSRLSGELGQSMTAMVDRFVNVDWWAREEAGEFDAEQFLLGLAKLRILESNATNPMVKQYLGSVIRRLKYKLNQDTVLYSIDWMTRERSSGLSTAIEQDFFVVPFAASSWLEEGNLEKYQTYFRQARVASGGGELQDGDDFAKMATVAEKAAQKWYQDYQATFESEQIEETLSAQRQFYQDNIQSSLYAAASRAIVSSVSRAQSQSNEAGNGLMYATINSEKANESAQKGDLANTRSYLNSAREHALELSTAARNLSEILLEARELKKRMHPEAAKRIRMTDVGNYGIAKLESLLAKAPRGGNENAIARDSLARLIDVSKAVEKIESQLDEARRQCERIDQAMVPGENALAAVESYAEDQASSPFDVSSKEAFEESKEKLAEVLSTQDYVEFTHAWVKILQTAIQEDPLVMADDEKYLAFLKKNFEGKTVLDILGK